MNKFALALLLMLAAPSYAQSGNYSAFDGPARMHVRMTTTHSEFSLYYDGYLYDCIHPSYDIRHITAHLIFHKGSQTKILVRRMDGLCTTPWNYTAPDLAFFSSFQGDRDEPEFWQLLREVIHGDADGVRPVFEVAFEYQGSWDSDYGRNFRLDFFENR